MSSPEDADPLVIYSDYVCPFCYLGKVSLDRYLASATDPPPMAWRPFDLRGSRRTDTGEIDRSIDDGKDDAYFEQARENVVRLADQYDVDLAITDARDVDSWNAQVAALVVRDRWPDRFVGFHDGLFDALWRGGRDIGDPAVIEDVAADAGIPEGSLRSAVTDGRHEAELRERFRAAREAGVTAVPTFAYGDHVARGAVPPAQLRRLVEGA